MKDRPAGFLSHDKIDHGSEIFSYVQELHKYLWRFIRAVMPGAGLVLDDCIDNALGIAEGNVDGQVDEPGQREHLLHSHLTAAFAEIEDLKTERDRAREKEAAMFVQLAECKRDLVDFRQAVADLLV